MIGTGRDRQFAENRRTLFRHFVSPQSGSVAAAVSFDYTLSGPAAGRGSFSQRLAVLGLKKSLRRSKENGALGKID
jgi:hypothetical protein